MEMRSSEFREGYRHEILEKEEQLVASRNCMILTDYTKRTCVGLTRLKNKTGNLYMHSQQTFMKTYNLFRLFLVQGRKEKEINSEKSSFHIYPV